MSYARNKCGKTNNGKLIDKSSVDYRGIFSLGKYLVGVVAEENKEYLKGLVGGNIMWCRFVEEHIMIKGFRFGDEEVRIEVPMGYHFKRMLKSLESSGTKLNGMIISEFYMFNLVDIDKQWSHIIVEEDKDFGDIKIAGIVSSGYKLNECHLYSEEFYYMNKWHLIKNLFEVYVPVDCIGVFARLEDRDGDQILSVDRSDLNVSPLDMEKIEISLSSVIPEGYTIHSITWKLGKDVCLYCCNSKVDNEVDLLLI